jgi:preprotein translocase subunit SecE
MENNSLVETVKSWPTRTRDYISELRTEMRRVSWPNRKQVEGTTVVTILTVFGFAAFFFVVDAILSDTVTRLYNYLSR